MARARSIDRRRHALTWRLSVAYPLALLVSICIATWAYFYGDQPVILDAIGYYQYARVIAAGGLGAFASDLRTYGYPAFLAVVIVLVGDDLVDLQAAVFVVQLALLLLVSWIAARRIEGALGIVGVGPWICFATAANPFLLVNTVQLLIDLPSALLLYLAVALSLPQRASERARHITLLAAGAFLSLGAAVMLRPASVVVVPIPGGIWIVRARLFRDLPWAVLPSALVALAVPFGPQVWSNYHAYGVPHPLIVGSIYTDMMVVGLHSAKTGSIAIPGVDNALRYDNPFRPPAGLTGQRAFVEHPGLFVGTMAMHAVALLDQDYAFSYFRDVDPWYRWPFWTLSHLYVCMAPAGFIVGMRQVVGHRDTVLRRRFTLATLAIAALASIAVYVPSEVQGRYVLPIYPLLAAPCVLVVLAVRGALTTAGPVRTAIGVLAVVIWLAGAAGLSIWLQAQAPLLVALRAGEIGPKAVARRAPKPVSAPIPTPGPTVPPAREIPVAKYLVELPKDLVAKRSVELDVTVTNLGHETWNVAGEYPVNVAVRFVAQTTEL